MQGNWKDDYRFLTLANLRIAVTDDAAATALAQCVARIAAMDPAPRFIACIGHVTAHPPGHTLFEVP